MKTIEEMNALRAKERELWEKSRQTKKADEQAMAEWCAASNAVNKALEENRIEAEVQKRLAECSGQLAKATLDARQIGLALVSGKTTLDECMNAKEAI